MKLLVVDDEPRTRNGIVTIISNSPIPIDRIQTASGPDEALTLAKAFVPDILITDIRMPLQQDGIALASGVHQLFPECQIIFISAYSDKEYLKTAITLKAVNYIEKPVVPDELLQAVEEAVRIHSRNVISRKKEAFLDRHRNIYAEKAALQLIQPGIDPESMERLNFFCPEFCRQHQVYVTILCQLQFHEDIPADAVTTGLNDVLKNGYIYLFAPQKDNLFVIHLCLKNSDNKQSYQWEVNRLFTEIKQTFSSFAIPFFSVGEPVSRVERIYASYQSAAGNMRNLFFSGYEKICYYDKSGKAKVSSYVPDADLLQNYEQALHDSSFEKAFDLAEQLYKSLANEINKDVGSIKDAYFHFAFLADSLFGKHFSSAAGSRTSNYLWKEISSKDTLLELRQFLNDKLADYALKNADKQDTSPIVYRIRKYIDQHYTEPDLSINKIAEQLHFTPAYLCQVFKKNTGITINSYLNSCRIEKAKELLSTSEKRLYDICQFVGYNDPNYFSRQFKKITGSTPTSYKEMNTT